MDTVQSQGIEPERDQRSRRFRGISAIPERPADPVTQFSAPVRQCEAERDGAHDSVVVRGDGKSEPFFTFPGIRVAGDPGLRDSIDVGVRNVQGRISDLARSGELLHNTRVLEAEWPEAQSLGPKRW